MNTTAITSTGMRMTQNLSAPPTQNTAPVYEFRCLYTSDLRRKQKRWQDGFLRFHTFNKRIMVYEAPSRNYVGDKHWREDEELQDGDELQLEKPVLVQVGEQIGSTETDLTELLEKRRKPQDKIVEATVCSPRRQNASTPITVGKSTARQPLVQPSQLRPKTLNALLGTPKKPIGRASLPTKSPHELRHENENTEWGSDRPAKRQRIDSRLEEIPKPTTRPRFRTLVNEEPCVGRHETSAPPNAAVDRPRQIQPTPSVSETIRRPEPPLRSHSPRVELDNASVDSAPSYIVPAEKQAKVPEAKSTVASAKRQGSIEKPRPSREVKERSPSRHINPSKTMIDRSPSHSTITAPLMKPVIRPIEIMSDEEATSTRKPPKERMKLQMASRKPRKKLMYRDLLPQAQHPAKRAPSIKTDPHHKNRETSSSSRPSRGATYALADFHQEEQDRLADRLNRYNGRTSHRIDDPVSITERRADSPGLFVSQEDLTASPASHHRTKDSSPESTCRPCINKKPRCATRQESPEATIPKAASTVHDTALTLSRMDQILFSRSRRSDPIEVRSQSHAVEDHSPVHDSSPSSILVTPTKTMLGPTPQKRSPPRTLIPSSPGFRIQSDISPKQPAPEEMTSSKVPFMRTRPPSPKVPSLSTRSSHALSTEEASTKGPQSKPLPSVVSLSNTPAPTVQPPKASLPNPPHPKASPPRLQTSPKARSPRPTSSKKSPPKDFPSKPSPGKQRPPKFPSSNPPLPRPLILPPTTTTTKPFFPNSLDTPAPEFDLRIAQKPLPAFHAPRPKPRTRSPLKKSTSDTTTMRPPPGLPNPVLADSRPGMLVEKVLGATNDGTATPWSKEAWDLFGCGRDGVQCSYEEFKRKEGLD